MNSCTTAVSPSSELEKKPGLVELAISVSDKGGAPIDNLKQSDFIVDSGSAQVPIESFHDMSGQRRSVVIVVDSSKGMQPNLLSVQKALGDLLKRLESCDEVAVVQFPDPARPAPNSALPLVGQSAAAAASVVFPPALLGVPLIHSLNESTGTQPPAPSTAVLCPFTTDHAFAFDRLYDLEPQGEARPYEGVFAGLQVLKDAHYPTRALILISTGDGGPIVTQAARRPKEDTLGELSQKGWPVYSVLITDAGSGSKAVSIGPFWIGRPPDQSLKSIGQMSSVAGSGVLYKAQPANNDDGKAIGDAISKISGQLGHTYIIQVYAPRNDWDAIRPFSVKVPAHPEAGVHVQRLPDSQT